MSRPVTITLKHDLGKEEALKRVQSNFDQVKSSLVGGLRMKISEQWDGDQLTFTAQGVGQLIRGEIDVFPAHVRIVVTLPTLLAGLAESISGQVEKKGQKLLAPTSPQA